MPLQVLRAGGMTQAFSLYPEAMVAGGGLWLSFCQNIVLLFWNIRIEWLKPSMNTTFIRTILENGGGEFTPKATIDLGKDLLALLA